MRGGFKVGISLINRNLTPMFLAGERVTTDNTMEIRNPQDNQYIALFQKRPHMNKLH